jgi:hypothetical protein
MPAATFLCPLDGCNAEFRVDGYIKHMRSEHKAALTKEMVQGINIRALNRCIKGDAMPFCLENKEGIDNYFICFGTKTVYKTSDLARPKCMAHLDEHRRAWMELYLECVAPATMIDMIATKYQMYDKYEKTAKRDGELEASKARVAELEGALAAMKERLREERVGELEVELAEANSVASRFRYESAKFERELMATSRELESVYRELDSVRGSLQKVSLESGALGLQAIEHSQSVKSKVDEHPRLKEEIKELKRENRRLEKEIARFEKKEARAEKENQEKMLATLVAAMKLGGGAGAGAGAGARSVGSRRSAVSSLDSDSDRDD